MKSFNDKLADEIRIISDARQKEFSLIDADSAYSHHHTNMFNTYRSLTSRIGDAIGYTTYCEKNNISARTDRETAKFALSLTPTAEQIRALKEIRRTPEFKMVLGLNALQQKETLETVLGTEINNAGESIIGEYTPRELEPIRVIKAIDGLAPNQAYKTETELESESSQNYDALAQALQDGKITEDQYDELSDSLDYIYSYYDSQSRGEQVLFTKISDEQYKSFEAEATESNIELGKVVAPKIEEMQEVIVGLQQEATAIEGPCQ